MSFTPKVVPTQPTRVGTPSLDASDRRRLELELRSIHQKITELVNAVVEIQTYLKTA